MVLERFTGVMKFDYDYRVNLWLDLKILTQRVLTAPLCLMGMHKYKEYKPKVDVCRRCNGYKINKKRRVN